MPRFTKGDLTVETAIPREAAELRRDGFKESKALTKQVREAEATHDNGGSLTAGPTEVVNDTGRAESVTAGKSGKSGK